jgi:Tfp pilus assembly protein PilN
MINLIPTEEKKEIRKDFYSRLLTVFFMMLCFLVLILLIATSPSYIVSLEKKVSISQRLEKQKNEVMPEIDQQAVISIKDLDAKLALLVEARKNQYIFSQKVINEIVSQRVSGIKITRFSYENNPLDGKKVGITGLAQDREQLLLFREALESDSSFKQVDLPISNFVKGADIEFNLNLISI